MTIHGKSRFPGLFVWLRDGRRVPVAIPRGCLLLQAGKQLEWLTSGHIKAGMHEARVLLASWQSCCNSHCREMSSAYWQGKAGQDAPAGCSQLGAHGRALLLLLLPLLLFDASW